MSNIVTLHGDKRWKAIIEYLAGDGPKSVEHFFEEMAELHVIIEHGPDWNCLIRCTITLNRPDDGESQNSMQKARREERSH